MKILNVLVWIPAVLVVALGVLAQWEGTQPQRGLASATTSLRADQAPIGEIGRNSKVPPEDVQNIQTDHFADAGNMVTALAALDARDHPGVTVSLESIVVAAATGRVSALGGSLTQAEMRAVLTEAGWPEELLAEALTVAYCESKWSNAKGDHNGHPTDGGYMSQGLFQMGVAGWRWVDGRWLWWNGWFRYFGYEDEQALDPLTNATVARLAYQRSGWGPWSCKP